MNRILKYSFDKIAALLGIGLLFPILIFVSVLIKLKMPDGPIFFKQKRVGKDGKLFTMVKFRTMRLNDGNNSVSVRGDARITPLGVTLRKYKLDELPELWNVFIGEMSLVGPRPDVPGYADKLTGDDRLILKLRPGITGPASLKYANEEELLANVQNPKAYNDNVIFPDKVKLNLHYYHNNNLMVDLKLILQTIF